MATSKKITSFEDVNAHVEKNFKSLPVASKKAAPKKAKAATTEASLVAANSKLCQAYGVARPILALVAGLPIIPKKWRDVINALIAALDVICPQN
jgi:hypothetical protein